MRLPFRRTQLDTADPETRVDALASAMELLDGDVDGEVVDRVVDCLLRAHERTGLDPATTVVALVGATGSGKSSLVNALVGSDLAQVGVVRPTTTEALGLILPGRATAHLLDWIGVSHRVIVPAGAGLPEGVALVDLPDIDSVSESNRSVAERLSARVDLLMWVLDPQKYADDIIHSQWIAPMASHAGATVTVLSQIDLLERDSRAAVIADLGRLLVEDGVLDPRIVEVSSVTGEGVDEVRRLIVATAETVREKALRVQGVLDDGVDVVVSGLELTGPLPDFDPDGLASAATAVAGQAAGVDRISDAVGGAYAHRSVLACGWLPVRWLRRFRADPLTTLHLGGGTSGSTRKSGDDDASDAAIVSVPSLPEISSTASAQLATGLRRVNDAVASGRPTVWQRRIRSMTRAASEALPTALDLAVAGVDLRMDRRPRWWSWSNVVQWIGWLGVSVGGLWLLVAQVTHQFLLIEVDVPKWRSLPIPTCLVVGGLALTLVVVVLSWAIARVAASRRRAQVHALLEVAIEGVLDERLVEPLVAEDGRQRGVVQSLVAAGWDPSAASR